MTPFPPPRRRSSTPVLPVVLIVAVVALVLAGVAYAVKDTHQQRDVVAKVTDKTTHCTASNSCQYLIFTDQGVFKDTDSMLAWKFNSSDVYGQIQVGKTYDFTVMGFRSGLLSEYPNIIKVATP